MQASGNNQSKLTSFANRFDNSGNYYQTREQTVRRHFETFIGIHKKFAEEGFRPEPDDVLMMSNVARNQGSFGLHYGAFCTTIASQGTTEQVMEWLLPAYQMKITGCLAQTELGHGSNVRGYVIALTRNAALIFYPSPRLHRLQTIAEYDKTTEEFVLNTPTLKSIKWWPGGLGISSQFCCVYANLITDGKEQGFHVFMCQLRDEEHRPLPGVEVKEVGPYVVAIVVLFY